MSKVNEIASGEAFRRLVEGDGQWIDVRSEGEFEMGRFENSVNIPLLNNEHRHQVGWTYKHQGTTAAVALGHTLVDPLKPDLQQRWKSAAKASSQLYVYCWRGGLRSEISGQWMQEAGLNPMKVQGGFKSLRQHVLNALEQPLPLILVAGLTGSQKTEIVQSAPIYIDLEAHANHRGSAFGLMPGAIQPSQVTFENAVGLAVAKIQLRKSTGQILSPVAIEDESRMIGKCRIPVGLHSQMIKGPCVWVEANVQDRARAIFQSYIEPSLSDPALSTVKCFEHFAQSLARIERRLGGLLHQQVLQRMKTAFTDTTATSEAPELHQKWIQTLLESYYDQQYKHSFQRSGRSILFRGSRREVEDYLSIVSSEISVSGE